MLLGQISATFDDRYRYDVPNDHPNFKETSLKDVNMRILKSDPDMNDMNSDLAVVGEKQKEQLMLTKQNNSLVTAEYQDTVDS